MFPMTMTINTAAELNAILAVIGSNTSVEKAQPKAEAKNAQKSVKQDAEKVEKTEPVANTQATAEASAAPEQKAENSAPVVDFDTLKTKFLSVAAAKRDVALSILAEFGLAKLSDAKADAYASILAKLQAA